MDGRLPKRINDVESTWQNNTRSIQTYRRLCERNTTNNLERFVNNETTTVVDEKKKCILGTEKRNSHFKTVI